MAVGRSLRLVQVAQVGEPRAENGANGKARAKCGVWRAKCPCSLRFPRVGQPACPPASRVKAASVWLERGAVGLIFARGIICTCTYVGFTAR